MLTVPDAAALIGVPVGTPMSIPGWNSVRPLSVRGPKPELIGPFTGQIKPCEPALTAPAGRAPAPPSCSAIFSEIDERSPSRSS